MSTVTVPVVGFPEYPKIDTLFERDRYTFTVDTGRIKAPVLRTISAWDVTEKIHGINIRICLSAEGIVTFGGRSDAAQIPRDLLDYLTCTFTADRLKSAVWLECRPFDAVLYGEGYGPGIKKGGGLYRKDKSFILFDALMGGKLWMDSNILFGLADDLKIDHVPFLGRMGLNEIEDLVKTPFASRLGSAMAEGIVAKPIEPLFDRRGERIVIKLKTKDFVSGKR